jgi:SAM-dependent methyltransferase
MKPTTTDDILDLLDSSFASVALGAAIELGLFWLLDEQPLDEQGVADTLGIPPGRCHYWLQLLARSCLIERGEQGYSPSPVARSAILEAYSRSSWTLLAEGARERLPGLVDLPLHLSNPGSAWQALGLQKRDDYVARMATDTERARLFTRMLYELHQPLADEVAKNIDLDGVTRLIDLGGGSGLLSLTLARIQPSLSAVVVDISSVCAAGREIAAEQGLGDRVTYLASDFVQDDLPSGFDLALECDVDVYSEALFHKIRAALNPEGRIVIIDYFAPAAGVAPRSRLHWAFEGSMRDPEFAFPTAAMVSTTLEAAGFQRLTERPLAPAARPCRRFLEGLVMIEAHK